MSFFLQQTINGVVLGSVYALYALGFGLVLANLKIFHLAHAAVFSWGAILAWELVANLGWPLALALPATAVLAGALNVVGYYLLIRHLVRRQNKEMAAFVSSLGGLTALAQLALFVLHDDVVRLPVDAFPTKRWGLFSGVQITSLQVLMLSVTAVLIAVLAWLVGRTEFGREIRTVAFSRDLAALLGVNVEYITGGVFFLSGALGGIAATLIALAFNVIDAHMGETYLLIAIAAMVIGGFGRIVGILVGGLLIGLTSSYSTAYIATSYRDLIVFALLLGFLALRPTGLFPTAETVDRV